MQRERKSIHSEASRKFAIEEIGVGSWHRQIQEEGLKLQFKTLPAKYSEQNNKSATSKMEVVRAKVGEWKSKGYVEQLSEPAWCNNPLSVAAKYDCTTGKIKYRPCIDLSRHVNKQLVEQHVRLDDLGQSEGLIEQGDSMAAFDLEEQFFHVEMNPQFKKYLGFTITAAGREQYYQFKVMPFGLSPAVAIVTRLLQPVKAYCAKMGIRLSIFVDDGRIVAGTEEEAVEQLQFVLEVLQLCGWNVQWDKTKLEASQELLHLGFITNTIEMMYRYPKEKEDMTLGMVGQLVGWCRQGVGIRARTWASLYSRLQAMHR
jgi:hypothetical protein